MSAPLDYRAYIGGTYKGSAEEAHGAVVIHAWDCQCHPDCDRVSGILRDDGWTRRFEHARPASFELPDHPKPPVV